MINKTSLFILVLTAISCGKDVGKYDDNYIGEWRSSTFTTTDNNGLRQNVLIIDSKNGLWGYQCNTDGEDCRDILTGNIKINHKRTKLYLIKLKGGSIHLEIEKEPYLNQNGVWTCLLDGIELYKQ